MASGGAKGTGVEARNSGNRDKDFVTGGTAPGGRGISWCRRRG